MSLARSAAGFAAQAGKARLAASTAAAISASPPLATSSMTSLVAGLSVSKVSLLATGSPSMRCLIMSDFLGTRPLSRLQ